jgi:hypothetical protein
MGSMGSSILPNRSFINLTRNVFALIIKIDKPRI